MPVSTSWNIAEYDRPKINALALALGLPHLVVQAMLLRGVNTEEEARQYVAPIDAPLADPSSLTDLDKAVKRIEKACAQDERILVFGDYDVDGITGTAIMARALKRFGCENCTCAMPNRLTDGYGLKPESVEQAHRDGASLIITVDNGINEREAAARARQLGIDLIITDHHQIEGESPDAFAIVNPKREGDSPLFDLCGAAVAHRLAWGLTGDMNADLDLVALGTVADIVPLQGENRTLTARGLEHMRRFRRPGLVKLAQVARKRLEDVSAEDIAFLLGPRLNAAGRLGDGALALELMLTDSEAEAERLARQLDRLNEERRAIEQEMVEDAERELAETLQEEQHSIVLARNGWHHGVVGIVAARLNRGYGRPVVLISFDDDGVGRASARSSVSFDLVGALSTCQEHVERFGGHKAAAGLTLTATKLDAFKAAFEAEAARRQGDEERGEPLNIDAQVNLSEVDAGLVRAFEQLEPCGHGNPGPVLCCHGVAVVPASIRVLKERHLKFSVRQGPQTLSAIGFNMAEHAELLSNCRRADIAFTPRLNTFRGETSLQLRLHDIHID